MQEQVIILTATVISLDVYTVEDDYLTASLGLDVSGEVWYFGGQDLFSSDPQEASANFVTHFMHRCLKVCNVKSIQDLPGEFVKIKAVDDRIVGLSSIIDDNWFYPALDFEALEKGEDLDTNEDN